jgi:hypothetical protein
VIVIFCIETLFLFMFPVHMMDSSDDLFSEDLRKAPDGKK